MKSKEKIKQLKDELQTLKVNSNTYFHIINYNNIVTFINLFYFILFYFILFYFIFFFYLLFNLKE